MPTSHFSATWLIYNEISYNGKSVILNRLFIPINLHQYIYSLVILNFSYNEKITYPPSIFMISELDCIKTEFLCYS
jgi:hypothetical protein